MSGSNLQPFSASAFVDEDGHYSWENYGGVFFFDGHDSDWIEDCRGLTMAEAEELASLLNSIPNFCKPLMEVDMDQVAHVISQWDKENNITKSDMKGENNGI